MTTSNSGDVSYPIRLNKYISLCGAASRRGADEMIAAGRVAIDGVTETSLGRVLDAPADVSVDGHPLSPARRTYLAMNKQRGVISAARDSRRRTVISVLPTRYQGLGLFPVGRLDLDSEGLILITNDGDFAQRILHPSNGVPRTYEVELARPLGASRLARWRGGVETEGGTCRPISVEAIGDDEVHAKHIRVVLGEGFKREIRLAVRELGGHVSRLKRTAIGKFSLEKLPSGAFCEYNHQEIMKMIFAGGRV